MGLRIAQAALLMVRWSFRCDLVGIMGSMLHRRVRPGRGQARNVRIVQAQGLHFGLPSHAVSFAPGRTKKTCEGARIELGIELEFVHAPHGAFTP